MRFVLITEAEQGDKILINLEQISHIFYNPPCIVMSGNHGMDGGSWGLLRLDEKELKMIVNELK